MGWWRRGNREADTVRAGNDRLLRRSAHLPCRSPPVIGRRTEAGDQTVQVQLMACFM